jgi:sterol desaturase/sphingolipid hydroxylase (fatty acid hydroxylase superfamily)
MLDRSHRLLHAVPSLYRLIHKQHHQYRGSIGFAAECAHPIEQIVSNQFPTAGGAMLFGFHPLVWLVWLTWRLLQTYESHSGLEIPLPAPFCWMAITDPHAVRWHDDHHSINTGSTHCLIFLLSILLIFRLFVFVRLWFRILGHSVWHMH